MRVLLIHTYYHQRGGEDVIFEQECALLSQSEDVQIITFKNGSGLRGVIQYLLSPWNIFAARKIKKKLIKFRPHLIHIHNWHFAIGPIAIRVANKANIPVVLTINNYRLLCPSATLHYNGNIFTDSTKVSFPWKAVSKKVYRDSTFLTFWLSFEIWFHKKMGTWQMVDKFIVNTDFAKFLFVNSSFGLLEEKYITKINFVNLPNKYSLKRGSHILFIGRLVEEKGIRILLEAFSLTNYELHIAGNGPLREEVLKASKKNENIKFFGSLDKEYVERYMQQCSALVFPSIWYEGMPMTLLEAFAAGTPVIASNLGAMASIVQDGYNGLHFNAGDAKDLIKKLNIWQKLDESEMENYRKNAFATYESYYTAERNKEQLINIYQNAIYAKVTR